MKIKVFLLTSDKKYVQNLEAAILKNYSEKMELVYFDSVEVLQIQAKQAYPDIVLVDQELCNLELNLPNNTYFAVLSDRNDVESIAGHIAVGKYQRVSGIYEQFLDIYSKKQDELYINLKDNDSAQIKILTFMSAAGGTGASTLAAACAKQLALRGENVVYMNLEQFGTADLFFNGDGEADFSQVIYALALNNDITMTKTATKMEKALKKDICGVRFFSACNHSIDMGDVQNVETLDMLFSSFKKMQSVKWIVVDCDCRLDETTLKQIERSYCTIIVSDGNEAANLKTERFFDSLKLIAARRDDFPISRVFIMYNRFGSDGKTLENQVFKELGRFGNVKNATAKEIMDLMNKKGLFNNMFRN